MDFKLNRENMKSVMIHLKQNQTLNPLGSKNLINSFFVYHKTFKHSPMDIWIYEKI